MTEQKLEYKKAGLTKRVFRWISLSVLGFLVILALIFQAPWKVTTLLLIFLAACTILSKKYRKWFWLSIGDVVVVLTIWIFLPEDNEGWHPFTFDEDVAAFEAKYSIPDEENAALAYDEIFRAFDIDSNQPDFFVSSEPSALSGPWLSKDHPETSEWIKSQQDIINKLMQVSLKEKCIFLPTQVDPTDYSEHLAGLYKVRQSIFLILSAANNDVAENRNDAGIKKYICVLKMADHFCQQPTLIDHMVGMAMQNKTLLLLNRFVIEDDVSDEQLHILADSMASVVNEWKTDWTKMLDFEYLYAKNSICGSQYEVNQEGKIRLSRGLISIYRQEVPVLAYFKKKCIKAETILRWFVVPATPQKAARVIEDNFKRYYAMTEPDYDWTREPRIFDSLITVENFRRLRFNFDLYISLTIDMFEENYYSIHEIYMKNLTLHRGSRILVAIKQYYNEHGEWPDSLDAIKSYAPIEAFIDPVTDEPLEYENHGGRFSLYGEATNIWPK